MNRVMQRFHCSFIAAHLLNWTEWKQRVYFQRREYSCSKGFCHPMDTHPLSTFSLAAFVTDKAREVLK